MVEKSTLYGYIIFFSLQASLVSFLANTSMAQSIIHFQNWEGEEGSGSWVSETGDTNQWLRGTDESGISPGNKSAYISSDAVNYGYDETVAEETYLYKDLDFPSDGSLDVEVTFDWKGEGEMFFDYMKVYIVDRSLATPTETDIAGYGGFVYELNGGGEFSGQSTFTTYNETLPTTVEGRSDLRIVFTWTNDNNTTFGDPAAIDNILITLGSPPSSLSGEYLVGQASGADFPTLTDATYFLNSYGVSGDVTFSLTDATYDNTTEAFPIVIDNFNTSPPSPSTNSNTLTIQPNTSVTSTITASVDGDATIDGIYHGVITINEADNVTIDGSNDGSSSRDLTLINTSTNAANTIFVGSSDPEFNDNVVIMNCMIEAAYSSGVRSSCVAVLDNTFTPGAGGFSGLVIDNNQLFKSDIGIYIDGGSAGDINGIITSVSDNDMDQSGADAINNYGIYIRGTNGGTVSGNSIGNFDGTENERDYGIYLTTGATNVTIEKNEIYDIAYTGSGGYGGNGIRLTTSTSGSGNVIRNNVIRGVGGDGENITGGFYTYNPFAIILTGSQSGVDIYNNSIFLTGNTLDFSSNSLSVGIGLASNSSADIRNNIIVNNLGLSGGTGMGSAAVFAQNNSSQFENINYNNYYTNASGSGGNYIGRIGSTNYTTISAWQTATGDDASSITADPGYTSASNLLPDASDPNSWYVNGTGVQIASVSEDFTETSRSVVVSTGAPDLGAYEFTPVSTPNSASVSGSHTNNGTETFTVAGRVIGEITWGASGTLPTINSFHYYSGSNPPDPDPGSAEYFNSYVDIDASGGSGYTFDLTLYYDEALIGTLSAETDIRLSKDDGSGWHSYMSDSPTPSSNYVTATGLSSFSVFTGSDIDNPLPVELMSFAGKVVKQHVQLTWETASEINNDFFKVERSSDTKSWEVIGHVEGNGTTDVEASYSFKDTQPDIGQNYYRLKQVDFDGGFEYSETVGVVLKTDHNFEITSLYPNPCGDQVNLVFTVPTQEVITCKVLDIAGNTVYIRNLEAIPGNNQLRINTSSLDQGLYFVGLNKSDGSVNMKFLKD